MELILWLLLIASLFAIAWGIAKDDEKAPVPIQYVRVYEVELSTRGTSASEARLSFRTENDVIEFAKQSLQPDVILDVACICGNVCYGSFVMFHNSEKLAYIRMLEHRGFFAKRQGIVTEDRQVSFWEGGDSYFSVEIGATVPREQALQALEYWLPQQQPLPTLVWEDD